MIFFGKGGWGLMLFFEKVDVWEEDKEKEMRTRSRLEPFGERLVPLFTPGGSPGGKGVHRKHF